MILDPNMITLDPMLKITGIKGREPGHRPGAQRPGAQEKLPVAWTGERRWCFAPGRWQKRVQHSRNPIRLEDLLSDFMGSGGEKQVPKVLPTF